MSREETDLLFHMRTTLKATYLLCRAIALKPLEMMSHGRCNGLTGHAKIRRILFIRIDRLGDLLLSTPALRALKEKFPAAKLTVLASRGPSRLLKNNPHVDRIVIYDHSASLRARYAVACELRKERFDLVVDPYDDAELETALIAGLSGAAMRIGYPRGGREAFLTTVLERPKPDEHIVDTVLGTLKPLYIHLRELSPEIFLTVREQEQARQWLTEQEHCDKPLIAIHPGAHYETQRWLPESFAALAAQLMEIGGARVVLFGGPGDEKIVDRILSLTKDRVLRCVTADIRLFAARLAQCHLLVCNNSGPLHVAVALKIPTVSIMGPTVKSRWMPRGSQHRVLRADDLPCIGCNAGTCRTGTHDCMRKISPERVMDAIAEAGIAMPGQYRKHTGHEDNRLHPLPS